MKSSIPVALGALIASVVAQPMVEKRDVTVIDWVTMTLDVWTTITGDAPAASSTAADSKHANHLAYHAENKAAVPAAPPASSSSPPAQQQQSPPENNPAPAPAPAPATGSTPEEIQAAENAKQEAINQKQIDTNTAQKNADFAHQNQMNSLQNGGGQPPVVQQQQQQAAPASSAPAAAPAAQSPAAAAPAVASNGGSCGSIGGSCSGDVTIYNDQGLGACGWNNDTNSQDFFALAAPMFGTYTNDAPGPHKNPFCGRMASISLNGRSFTGMLTDRCGGCVGQSIDLSQHLFSQLYPNEPPGNGRYHDVSWQFMSGPTFSQG